MSRQAGVELNQDLKFLVDFKKLRIGPTITILEQEQLTYLLLKTKQVSKVTRSSKVNEFLMPT